MVDWGAGRYETTAEELAPVSERVVDRSGVGADTDVVDVACGTGNAALLAAARGARVIGVDGAPRLLAVARERAAARGLEVDLREGDLAALPVNDGAADVVLSVFGVIFATDPAAALREIARVLRPDGRALVTAWVPAGPIDAMLGAAGRVMARVAPGPPRKRFAWFDPEALAPVARESGLTLATTEPAELEIRAASPEAYVDAGSEHPMALAMRPALERAGAGEEARAAMIDVLREANESPSAFLVHSPYVLHGLRRTS
ncbi:class I SAM-dependent methyltransferase [Solirubrobacter deserti]|uniref:Class I SAM-dependent methyltransferase n=1 Tax=Solirubrobacter deserti TaxID=2282478 RepID=A0ABT4RJV1_9ACTN|nr:class I SAM-dependent methyltransferase [Solirubrobacter deserti]MDA0138797.1 class I SAM-dependent methyltransferase [Solirubrobacter deserti]